MFHCPCEDRIQTLSRPVCLFQIGSLPPQFLPLGEDAQSIGQDRTSSPNLSPPLRSLGVSHPSIIPILLFHFHRDRRLYDRLARPRRAVLFALFRLFEPLIASEEDTVFTELADTGFDRLVDTFEFFGALGVGLFGVAGLLFDESTGGDPDFVAGRNGFPRFVENGLGLVRRLQPRERQPQLDREGDDFDCTGEEDPCVCDARLEVDRLLPQSHGCRDMFEGLSENPFLCFEVMFEVGGGEPDLDALADVLDSVGEDDLGVVVVVEASGFEPYVFVFRAVFASELDDLAGFYHATGVFFETGGGDPSGCVRRVALDETVKEHAGAFDVSDFGFGLDGGGVGVEGGEVAFGVDGGGGTAGGGRCGELVELEREDLVTGLADFDKVGQRCGGSLLSCHISTAIDLGPGAVSDEDAVWDDPCPAVGIVLAATFSAGKVSDLGDVFPFCVGDGGEAAFEVGELLLDFGAFSAVLGEGGLFGGFSGGR